MNFGNEITFKKWMLQPVRRCCKGSLNEQVAPA